MTMATALVSKRVIRHQAVSGWAVAMFACFTSGQRAPHRVCPTRDPKTARRLERRLACGEEAKVDPTNLYAKQPTQTVPIPPPPCEAAASSAYVRARPGLRAVDAGARAGRRLAHGSSVRLGGGSVVTVPVAAAPSPASLRHRVPFRRDTNRGSWVDPPASSRLSMCIAHQPSKIRSGVGGEPCTRPGTRSDLGRSATPRLGVPLSSSGEPMKGSHRPVTISDRL